MATSEQIIQLALSYVGTKEDPPGSNITPFTIAYYNGKLPPNPAASSPWCVIFGWYVFREAGAGSLLCDGAKVGSCSAVLRWAKANNLTVAKEDAQRGDIILFDWHVANGVPDHFGFALGSPESGKIRTVEGNTEDMVAERLRNMTDVGYVIRPKYAASPGSDFVTREELRAALRSLLDKFN